VEQLSTLDDLEYLWSFSRLITLLGSGIWKNKLPIGGIFNSMINSDNNGIVFAIIQDVNGPVNGLSYMDQKSIGEICEKRKLRRAIMKGEISGNVQYVIKISVDCYSDTMLITDDSKKPFCHTGKDFFFSMEYCFVFLGNHSCFNLQTPSILDVI
jgi:phosphoribosyl-AMP cyclohydrolase